MVPCTSMSIDVRAYTYNTALMEYVRGHTHTPPPTTHTHILTHTRSCLATSLMSNIIYFFRAHFAHSQLCKESLWVPQNLCQQFQLKVF